jgi:N6-L-threonylcarbamoyladenine synthase
VGGLNFSFSGLKTSILYFLQRETAADPDFAEREINSICASIQKTIVEILMRKLKKAVLETGIDRVALAGGVAANSGIRKALQEAEVKWGWTTHVPPLEYCTDNAAMIGIAGYLKYLEGRFTDLGTPATARYTIGS